MLCVKRGTCNGAGGMRTSESAVMSISCVQLFLWGTVSTLLRRLMLCVKKGTGKGAGGMERSLSAVMSMSVEVYVVGVSLPPLSVYPRGRRWLLDSLLAELRPKVLPYLL